MSREHPRPGEGVVVTVGSYDGVHLGHRHLIAAALDLARERGARCVVVTFDRHPAAVLRPELAPRLLTAVDHKLELLETSGVDGVHLVHFDHVRAKESAEDFVADVLVGELAASAVVVGANFRFGYERRGDLDELRRSGPAHGFDVLGVELYGDPHSHEVVTSSRIRALIASGELERAAVLLGRPHEVRGFVTNAPSAPSSSVGLAVDTDLLLPPEGRYTVALRIGAFRTETTALVEGELVELASVPAATAEAVHPGARVACLFTGPATGSS